jgi:hypothetical protein
MARYVAVSIYDYDKLIKDGPFEINDPSEQIVEEGQRLMLEEVALAAGYHYAEGAAFSEAEGHDHGKHRGHEKRDGDKHGNRKRDHDK